MKTQYHPSSNWAPIRPYSYTVCCPARMPNEHSALFTLCLIPLLRILDDVTLFVTAPLDIQIVREAIQCYERALEACLNTRKSKALAVGAWDNTTEVLDIPYYNEVQILGFSTASTVEMSVNTSWMKLMARTREQAQGAYGRELCLSHWICYVHSHLLAKIWHTAQVFPAPRECVRQLKSAVAWYTWLGATFIRVSISTLQCKKDQGGWELLDVAAKCRALLLSRMWDQGQREWSATAAWLQYWHLLGTWDNPHVGRIPRTMGYLRMHAQWPITIPLCRHNL